MLPPPLPRRAVLAAALGGLGGLAACSSSGKNAPAPVVSSSPPPRTLHTVMGDVTVTGQPSRVVTLDTAELDSALTLGVTPVGACRAAVDSGFPDYWPRNRTSAIRDVGTIGKPDLRTIAALRPDLILSNKTRDAAHYPALSRIAPTVFSETTGFPWKDNFRLHAQALGLSDAGDTVIDAYATHVTQVTAALGGSDKAGARKVAVVRFVEGQAIRLYGEHSFIGSVLDEVGLGRPSGQDQPVFAQEITADRIGEAAPAGTALLVHASYGDPAKSQQRPVTGGSVWKGLAAVRGHRVLPVDDQLWFLGIGYTGANALLAQLQRALGA